MTTGISEYKAWNQNAGSGLIIMRVTSRYKRTLLVVHNNRHLVTCSCVRYFVRSPGFRSSLNVGTGLNQPAGRVRVDGNWASIV